MEDKQFEATLSGTDTSIDGIVTKVMIEGYINAFQFNAIDNTLHLTIGMDKKGHWHRVDGTEPYLGSWTNELAGQIA